MADCLVTRFALIAYKGEKFNAHRGEAKLFLVTTIGTLGVGLELCKLLNAIFCHGGHLVYVVGFWLLVFVCAFL